MSNFIKKHIKKLQKTKKSKPKNFCNAKDGGKWGKIEMYSGTKFAKKK